VNDWLNCDRDNPGYHIMTDDKTVNNLRIEEGLQITKMTMMKRKNVPLQSNALQALDLAITWMEWQEE
jgi:hypothetical protein